MENAHRFFKWLVDNYGTEVYNDYIKDRLDDDLYDEIFDRWEEVLKGEEQ